MINTQKFFVGLKIDRKVYDKYVELGFNAEEWSEKNFGNKIVIV